MFIILRAKGSPDFVAFMNYNLYNAIIVYYKLYLKERHQLDQNFLSLLREELRRLQRALGWQVKNDASCCGVTVAQCHVVLELGQRGELSLVALADALGLDTSTLSRTVENMVQEGLVERRNDPRDRRFILLTLTSRGRAVKEEIDYTYNNYFSGVLEHIPKGKHTQVLESVHLLAEAFARNGRGEVNPCCREEER